MALDRPPPLPNAAEVMAAAAAQTMFDGALTTFRGHVMDGRQPHQVSAAARECHNCLDQLLAATRANLDAYRRSMGL